MFTVTVDPERCQGHARCFAFAPEVFDFDDEGYSYVPEQNQRFEELPQSVQQAVANCPERAVVLNQAPAS
jgi:ferredoxin